MFCFKNKKTCDLELTGIDGSCVKLYNVPVALRGSFVWAEDQMRKGREAARLAGLAAETGIKTVARFKEMLEEIGVLARRSRELADKRDAEIAALRSEVEGLSSALVEARDERDEAVKELQALSDEVDAALEDTLRGCGKKPRAVKKQKKGLEG